MTLKELIQEQSKEKTTNRLENLKINSCKQSSSNVQYASIWKETYQLIGGIVCEGSLN